MYISLRKIRKWPWTKIGALFTSVATIIALLTLGWDMSVAEKTTRPYIGIVNFEDVEVSTDSENTLPDGSKSNTSIVTSLDIQNFGALPAYFSVKFVSDYESEVRPCQISSNYIMPEQTITLCWYENKQVGINDVCDMLESSVIEIKYGRIGDRRDEYSSVLAAKKMTLPSSSDHSKKIFTPICKGSDDQMYFFDWYMQKMH